MESCNNPQRVDSHPPFLKLPFSLSQLLPRAHQLKKVLIPKTSWALTPFSSFPLGRCSFNCGPALLVKLDVEVKVFHAATNGCNSNPAVHHRPYNIIQSLTGLIDANVGMQIIESGHL